MNRDELREAAWQKESCKGCEACQFEGDGSCDDWARQLFVKGFDAGYEAGQRAERERITTELSELLLTGIVTSPFATMSKFINELRAEPAESGE